MIDDTGIGTAVKAVMTDSDETTTIPVLVITVMMIGSVMTALKAPAGGDGRRKADPIDWPLKCRYPIDDSASDDSADDGALMTGDGDIRYHSEGPYDSPDLDWNLMMGPDTLLKWPRWTYVWCRKSVDDAILHYLMTDAIGIDAPPRWWRWPPHHVLLLVMANQCGSNIIY